MKTLLSFFFLFSILNNPTIAEIRKLYPKASETEKSAKEFASKFENFTSTDKVLIAYKGASITVVAKFQKKAGDKIRKFKEGAKFIEQSILNDPNNIEIRFIRLSVQENVPGIVKYKMNIKEDKTFLLTHYNEQSSSLKEYLKDFILQSKSFSAQEKKTIK